MNQQKIASFVTQFLLIRMPNRYQSRKWRGVSPPLESESIEMKLNFVRGTSEYKRIDLMSVFCVCETLMD